MGFFGLLYISYHKSLTYNASRDPTLEACRAALQDAVYTLVQYPMVTSSMLQEFVNQYVKVSFFLLSFLS